MHRAPKEKLDFLEQQEINNAGGIKNLANKRNVMNEARYQEAKNQFTKQH